jgi:predicted  nucleic acid-binding Zn-ribbon protein
LTAATASWGEAHARLDNDVAALRLQMDQLSVSMSSRVEEVCRRVEAQEREISTIQANASELASKMAVAAERLEKHATAIRSLHDSHRERTEVFGQMGELLHRLNHRPAATEGSAL